MRFAPKGSNRPKAIGESLRESNPLPLPRLIDGQ
jgi:hypothetical protein